MKTVHLLKSHPHLLRRSARRRLDENVDLQALMTRGDELRAEAQRLIRRLQRTCEGSASVFDRAGPLDDLGNEALAVSR